MNIFKLGFCGILALLVCTFQAGAKEDTATVNKLIADAKVKFGDDPAGAFDMAKKAKDLSVQLRYQAGEAQALKTIGIFYYGQQKFPEALDYWEQSVKVFTAIKDDAGVANILNNIGAIYFSKGNDAKALDYCLQSLRLAEKAGDKTRIMSALVTIGSIYHNKKDPRAIEYNLKALPICEELGRTADLALLMTNLGEIYLDTKNYPKALEYFNKVIALEKNSTSAAFAFNGIGKVHLERKEYDAALRNHAIALQVAQKLDDKAQQFRAYWGEANVYAKQNNIASALTFYQQAKTLAEEVKAYVDLEHIYKQMADAYATVPDFANAFLHNKLYADVKDTLYRIDMAKQSEKLLFDYDLEKKQSAINLLAKEKSLQEAEVKRQKQAKTAFAVGLVLLLIIAFEIYRNYRNKVKTNKILDNQKAQIEGLLLNILPAEVAKELQTTGDATPRSYKNVSVLFSDFKGFTTIADKMSPEELVAELNTCFREFDRITDKYGLEKIKTIGDSYMCAGGLPAPDEHHVYKIVKASLEIQQYMADNNQIRVSKGLEPWYLRIGINVGPVVAGVVGKRKYAYDIWGGTVNVASRMESSGEPGRVNISAATYDQIKHQFICSHRGKIHAKNVGEIDMFFVDYEIDEGNKLPVARATDEEKVMGE